MALDLVPPVCVALDTLDEEEIVALADATGDHVGCFKVGLTAFASLGPSIITRLAGKKPVFLDLKLHDIPAQVTGAVHAAEGTGASLLTVHASGGREMLRAAADAADDIVILAVTVLTSLDDDDLSAIGMSGPAEKAVLNLAELALSNGAGGLVCSPLEVAALRERFGPRSSGGPFLVVPGIRPAGGSRDDQRRTLTPAEAIDAGADLIVVGRPITAADDPAAAAAEIVRGLR